MEDEQENAVDNKPPIKVKSYKEANELLEDVQHLLDVKGHITEVIAIGSIADNVSSFQLAATRQTTLYSWLSNANHFPLFSLEL